MKIYILWKEKTDAPTGVKSFNFEKQDIITSRLKPLIVDDPSRVSVKDAYIGDRDTLSSLRNSRDVDL